MNAKHLTIAAAILLAACGIDEDDDDATTVCETVPDVQDDAAGDLALVDVGDEASDPVYAERVRIEIGDRVVIDFGGVEIDFARPPHEGRYTLAELGARFCSWKWTDCPDVDGIIDVTMTERRAFEAVVDMGGRRTIRDELVIQGAGRFRHVESDKQACYAVPSSSSSSTPDLGCGCRGWGAGVTGSQVSG